MIEENNQKIIALSSRIISSASVVGSKELNGPLGECFDEADPTDEFGESSWDRAESAMQRRAFDLALKKAGITENGVDAIFGGDLQNQCTAAAYAFSGVDSPFFGLYGACSTSAEAIMLSSVFTTYKVFSSCVAITSSHNCSAEMQYRTPLEYGAQRTPTAQWTVTGAGAFVITSDHRAPEDCPIVCEAMPGRVIEMGIRDTSNMGAAMAPAAADTLLRYLSETRLGAPERIFTGDLGYEGSALLLELMSASGCNIDKVHNDCGMLIYSRERQDTHSGGSGCGCSAAVLAGYILPRLLSGKMKDIVILATGAMMSPSSIKQGEAIPAIAHLVRIRSSYKGE